MKNKSIVKLFTLALIVLFAFVGTLIVYFNVQKQESPQSIIFEKIYVAVEGTGEIAVINAKTNTLIKHIDLSKHTYRKTSDYMAHNVQVAPNGKSVWTTANVMSTSDSKMEMSSHEDTEKDYDELIVIDPLTDTIMRRIEMGKDLHLTHVVLTSDNSYALVASQEKGILYKVNTATFQVEATIATTTGAEPHGLRIAPDDHTAYIAMLGGKSLGILDITNFSLTYVPLKGAAVQTGVTADGRYALTSVYDAKSLAVYDIASTKLSYIDLPAESKGPVQIYLTPDSRYVYVADQGYYFNQSTGNQVYKIDLQEMKVVQAIKAGEAPHGIVVSRDGKSVYVTNLLSEDVSVIDVDMGKEIARIKVGNMPNGISLWYPEESE